MHAINRNCPFCLDADDSAIRIKYKSVYTIPDKFPVTPLHHLIIPFRHTQNFFSMNQLEINDAFSLIKTLKDEIIKEDNSVVGFNIGMNCGQVAGQTVMHAHIHLLPRRQGDTSDPAGGVRGVVPHKMSY